MGGEAGDADLRSNREIKQRLHRIVRLSGFSQGRTLRQARQHKQKLDGAAWGYEGWICSSPSYPQAGSTPCRAVCSRSAAGARHEAARNGSDQLAAIRWRRASRAGRGVDSLGTAQRPLRAVVTAASRLVGPPQRRPWQRCRRRSKSPSRLACSCRAAICDCSPPT